MRLNHLGLFVIEPCQFTACPTFGTEQLVELGVDRLVTLCSAGWMIRVMNQVAIVATACQSKLPGSRISHAMT
jgi:hypothetical protein